MSYQSNQSEPTVSVELRLLIDRLCDLAESGLQRGERIDWDHLFNQVDAKSWPLLIDSLVPQIRQFLGHKRSQPLLELFSNVDPVVLSLVRDYCEQTAAPDSDSMLTVFGPRRNLDDDGFELPAEIDHFKIVRLIGRGGFGHVLLAHDKHLDREVVIKIPRQRSFESNSDVSSFMGEARKIALLEHPGIVRIHHVGVWQTRPYLVQQYVAGGDLKQALLTRDFSYQEVASLLAEVAETIAYAHRLRIVHRDIKPANILLDEKGKPLVADFGLAIHESEQYGKGGIVAGTAHYMAPEQLRGEVHRLDARTDLWSLGVCMYLMLTKELPFQADDSATLRVQVNQQPCRPPRQLNPDIPWELERICLKCLSKRMDDRYSTGVDLAAELRAWLASEFIAAPVLKQSDSLKRPVLLNKEQSLQTAVLNGKPDNEMRQALVPKGLLAFDQKDHDFFLSLVPGPRTKYGIPEQLNFWVERIATNNVEDSICVGLIYGPSGCGKSSFVKAGLLPLLPRDVAVVYVEATDTDTEVRLLTGLRKLFPEIPRDQDLPKILSQLRRGKWLGSYRKVLMVFDQFEQWLHVNEVSLASQLIEGLRHCDGVKLQAVLLARDDFWMKVSRFFQELEIPLEERKNYQPLYLFDLEHAKNVLMDFGLAYRRLPEPHLMEAKHDRFLKEAIEKLADKGKVICIHLVLLAETLKEREWTLASLRDIGSLDQIGVLFLEQQFSSTSSNPSHRLLLSGIAKTFEFLLPADEANIKARFRERSQIAEASGFDADSKQFAAMMNILERNLRLISAVDPDQGIPATETTDHDQRYYQLSHDFLVPSVRHWLNNLQRQSTAGRAKARLQALASSFAHSQDKRYIPSFWEFADIVRHVRRRECSAEANNLYLMALKLYAKRAAICAAMLSCMLAAWQWNRYVGQRQVAMLKLDQWLHARPEELSLASPLLTDQRSHSVSAMREMLDNPSASRTEYVRLLVGLALTDSVSEDELLQLVDYVPTSSQGELGTLRQAFQHRLDVAVPALLEKFQKVKDHEQQIKVALVLFHLGHADALLKSIDYAASPTRSLLAIYWISTDSDQYDHYLNFLRDKVAAVEQHDLLANLVKGLAQRSTSMANQKILSEWIEICQKYFKNSPSGLMHSASEFALGKLGAVSPQVPQAGSQTQQLKELAKRSWYSAPGGLTMIRVSADGAKIPGETEDGEFVLSLYPGETLTDFWISSTEVPVRLFRQFKNGADNKDLFSNSDGTPADDVPITNITLVDAMGFCNWLSDQDGFERYYIETSEPFELQGNERDAFNESNVQKLWEGWKQWKIRSDSNGYRLPSIGEGYFLPFGVEPPAFPSTETARKILSQYHWYAENTEPPALQPIGQLMPDRFGLFDSAGNASEWAFDARFPVARLEHRVSLDSYLAPIQKVSQRKLTYTLLWVPGRATSFRVARSIKKQK